VLTLNTVTLNKITTYLKEVYVELLHKTSWPSFKELQKESLIVLIASVVFSLLIMVMDGTFKKVMDLIYNL